MSVTSPDYSEVASGPPIRLRRMLGATALVVLAVLAFEQLELTPSYPLTFMLMQTHDVPVLLAVCALLLALAAVPLPAVLGQWAKNLASWPPYNVVVPIVAAVLVVAWGTRYVANYTPVSHDEIMAAFDAAIFASGRIMAPIEPQWRSLSWALEPVFRLPVAGDVAWVSTYLPGNAAIRGLLGNVFDAAIVNAMLVGVALVALAGVARRLWPERPELAAVAVVLAVTSSQVLCMGMTPFAMTAHLTLNMVWLWLYLRNTHLSHAAAIAVGFLATGLHQLIFHPIFAAPFILHMLIDRRWRLGAVYATSYAAIGVFWIVYWQLLLAGHGIAAPAEQPVGVSFFFDRVAGMLRDFSASGPETMLQNLLRFSAWQNPLLVVLLVPGMILGWKSGGVMRCLTAGIVLTLLAMLILLPYQDIGWGYRYVHGLIGSAALLAAFLWGKLIAQLQLGERLAAWCVMAAGTAVALLILLPIHAWQMYAYLSPYTRANASIAGSTSEAVVIATFGIHHGIELVRNDPYLRNRPLTFDIGVLDDALARELCSKMRVSVFGGEEAQQFGITGIDPRLHADYERLNKLRLFLESAECRELHGGR
ncbi:MAG TPA: hypothetical protein VFR73_11225 [Hyphomicrobiaceae bacterium]|nr:hypothetical protein [Hyphomicrobiaceae bacterium]